MELSFASRGCFLNGDGDIAIAADGVDGIADEIGEELHHFARITIKPGDVSLAGCYADPVLGQASAKEEIDSGDNFFGVYLGWSYCAPDKAQGLRGHL